MNLFAAVLALVLLVQSARDTAGSWLQKDAGSRITFTRLREDVDRPGSDFRFDAEIWMMNGDGSEPARLTFNTTDDLGANWSPDGRSIAFERDIEPIAARIIQVVVVDADTPDAEVVALTMLPSENGHPGWSHGRLIRPAR